ncbi:MAG: hypothetical protein Q8M94_14755, partial [Ignavibacteria bacterium]|nr:hypothetical protein [Ignavibacteria bacterium]
MRYIAEILCYCFALNLYAQDFWEETSGPIGGWVQCLAVDNQNNVYAGFDAGWFGENHKGRCFYRSNNLGGYWVSINTINYNKDIESIAIDSSGYIYLWEGGVGLLKSTDEGINWIRKSFGLNDFFNAKIKVCKNNSLILGHYDGVYVSTNCGITWNLTSLTNWSNSIFVDSSDNIFVS